MKIMGLKPVNFPVKTNPLINGILCKNQPRWSSPPSRSGPQSSRFGSSTNPSPRSMPSARSHGGHGGHGGWMGDGWGWGAWRLGRVMRDFATEWAGKMMEHVLDFLVHWCRIVQRWGCDALLLVSECSSNHPIISDHPSMVWAQGFAEV